MSVAGGGNDWTYFDRLEKKKEKAAAAATGGVAAARYFHTCAFESSDECNRNVGVSCRALFQNKAKLGQDNAQDLDSLWTSHEGAISDISVMSSSKLSTAGLDGKIVVWDLPQLDIAMSSLGL